MAARRFATCSMSTSLRLLCSRRSSPRLCRCRESPPRAWRCARPGTAGRPSATTSRSTPRRRPRATRSRPTRMATDTAALTTIRPPPRRSSSAASAGVVLRGGRAGPGLRFPCGRSALATFAPASATGVPAFVTERQRPPLESPSPDAPRARMVGRRRPPCRVRASPRRDVCWHAGRDLHRTRSCHGCTSSRCSLRRSRSRAPPLSPSRRRSATLTGTTRRRRRTTRATRWPR